MNQHGVILPPEDDPDPTDRLPELDSATAKEPGDPLESTGSWAGSSEELVARVAALERTLEERDAAVAELASVVRQRTSALGKAEEELELARADLVHARLSASRAAELEQRVEELEGEKLQLSAVNAEQRATIARLEDQLSEARVAELPASVESRLAALAAQREQERAGWLEVEQRLSRELKQERLARSRAERELSRHEEELERVASVPMAPASRRCLVRLDRGREAVYDLPLAHSTTIGRTPDNDLQVRENYISRSHAIIKLNADNAIIEDSGSRNGVFVNDRRITRELLRDGDIVTLGKARFRFSIKGA